MLWKTRTVTSNQLALEYADITQAFAHKLSEQLAPSDDCMAIDDRQLHCWAAAWAAAIAASDASALTDEDKKKLLPAALQALLIHWRANHPGGADGQRLMEARALDFLRARDRSNQLKTAANFVDLLLSSLGTAAPQRAAQSRSLTSLFAHRLLSDVGHFNEVKARYSIN